MCCSAVWVVGKYIGRDEVSLVYLDALVRIGREADIAVGVADILNTILCHVGTLICLDEKDATEE